MRSLTLEILLGLRDQAPRNRLDAILAAWLRPTSDLALLAPAALLRRSRWNPLSRPLWALRDQLREALSDIVVAARTDARLAGRPDILAKLMNARGGGRQLTDDELTDEMMTMVAAGHDTLAASIAWAIDLLAHHPEVAGNVRTAARAGDTTYLRAVAKEVMRARTVIPMTVLRRPLEPFKIGGGVIAPNVVIRVDTHSLHNDPRLHPQPEAFRGMKMALEGLLVGFRPGMVG